MERKIRHSAVDLTDLALGIIVLGIVVAVGSAILITTRDSRLTSTTVTTRNNEAVTLPADGTGDTLAQTWVQGVVDCYNGTNYLIAPANYSVTVSDLDGTATITNLTSDPELANSDAVASWTCNYTTYDTNQSDYALADNAAIGIGEYGNWFKIIVIVGIAGLVLSLIFLTFGRAAGSSGAGGVGGDY